MKSKLKICGKTNEGREALGGCFKLLDTHGLPLTEIMVLLEERNMVVAWDDFYQSAIKAGWKEKTIDSRIEEATTEFYNKQEKEEFLKKYQELKDAAAF